MTIQEGIEKAIDGGWMWNREAISHYEVSTNTFVAKNGNTWIRPAYAVILLDPLFWQAIGKAIGKTNIHGGLITMCRNCSVESGANSLGSCDYCGGHEWGNFQRWDRYSMNRFIDYLCDGFSLEEALKRATS